MIVPVRRNCWQEFPKPLSAESSGYECIHADTIWELKNMTMIYGRDRKFTEKGDYEAMIMNPAEWECLAEGKWK